MGSKFLPPLLAFRAGSTAGLPPRSDVLLEALSITPSELECKTQIFLRVRGLILVRGQFCSASDSVDSNILGVPTLPLRHNRLLLLENFQAQTLTLAHVNGFHRWLMTAKSNCAVPDDEDLNNYQMTDVILAAAYYPLNDVNAHTPTAWLNSITMVLEVTMASHWYTQLHAMEVITVLAYDLYGVEYAYWKLEDGRASPMLVSFSQLAGGRRPHLA